MNGRLALAALLLALPAASADPAQPALDAVAAETSLALAYADATEANAAAALAAAQGGADTATRDAPRSVGLPSDEAWAVVGVAADQGARTVAFAGAAGGVLVQAVDAIGTGILGQGCVVPVLGCSLHCPTGGNATLGTAPRPCPLFLPLPSGAPPLADPGAPNVTLAVEPAGPFLRGPVHLVAEASNTVQVSSLAILDGGDALAQQTYGDTAATRRLEFTGTLPEGHHTLRARASGGVREGASGNVTVVVDLTAPRSEARLGSALRPGDRIALEATDAVSGVAYLAWRLSPVGDDSAPYQAVASAHAEVVVAAGAFVLETYAIDAAGNTEEPHAVAFEVAAAPGAPAEEAARPVVASVAREVPQGPPSLQLPPTPEPSPGGPVTQAPHPVRVPAVAPLSQPTTPLLGQPALYVGGTLVMLLVALGLALLRQG